MAYGLNQTGNKRNEKTNDKNFIFVDLWLRNDQKPLFECSVELQTQFAKGMIIKQNPGLIFHVLCLRIPDYRSRV